MGIFGKIKSVFWPSGIPVYIEDDGTLLGYVVDKIEGENGNRTYKIKTDVGIVEVPGDSVIVTKKALIYRPPWSKEIEEFIDKLEKEKLVNPDLELALTGGRTTDEKIQDIIRKGREFRNLVLERRKGFIEMRDKNIREMQYLMQKRMANAIDKSEYVNEMNELRKKIKILEMNIEETEKLLAKLNYPAFKPENVEKTKEVPLPVPMPVNIPSGKTESGMQPPNIEKKRVKKLRVLKVEADLIAMQSKLKGKESLSQAEIEIELDKINNELTEMDKILQNELTDAVREYFEKRRRELMDRKSYLEQILKSRGEKSGSEEEEEKPVENEENILEEETSSEEKEESEKENLDLLLREIIGSEDQTKE